MANAAWDSPVKVAAWLNNRGNGIGSSDASSIVGCNPWKSAFEVWLHKVEGSPATGNLPDDPAMRAGLILEPAVARYYELEFGVPLHEPEPRVHPHLSWMGATADRVVVERETSKPTRIVELKTASGFSKGWGEPGTAEIPEMYMVQVQHQLAVYQLDLADVAVLIDGRDFRVYQIERNQVVIDSLIEIEAAFWDRVQRREPPDPDWEHPATPKLIDKLYQPDPGKVCTLSPEAIDDVSVFQMLASELKDLEAKVKTAKAQRDSYKSRIVAHMKDAAVATGGGLTVTRKVVNVAAHKVEAFSYPRFTVKGERA